MKKTTISLTALILGSGIAFPTMATTLDDEKKSESSPRALCMPGIDSALVGSLPEAVMSSNSNPALSPPIQREEIEKSIKGILTQWQKLSEERAEKLQGIFKALAPLDIVLKIDSDLLDVIVSLMSGKENSQQVIEELQNQKTMKLKITKAPLTIKIAPGETKEKPSDDSSPSAGSAKDKKDSPERTLEDILKKLEKLKLGEMANEVQICDRQLQDLKLKAQQLDEKTLASLSQDNQNVSLITVVETSDVANNS